MRLVSRSATDKGLRSSYTIYLSFCALCVAFDSTGKYFKRDVRAHPAGLYRAPRANGTGGLGRPLARGGEAVVSRGSKV